jgi:predicted kinase
MRKLLIQMSGCPGSGKSTIACAIGEKLPAVVLDHDVLKSALLENGVETEKAGGVSYGSLRAMAGSILRQGFSVVRSSVLLRSDFERRNRVGAAQRSRVSLH